MPHCVAQGVCTLTKEGGENIMLSQTDTAQKKDLPLAFQFKQRLSGCEKVICGPRPSPPPPTARNSGGTTGGGPASEDANIDFD